MEMDMIIRGFCIIISFVASFILFYIAGKVREQFDGFREINYEDYNNLDHDQGMVVKNNIIAFISLLIFICACLAPIPAINIPIEVPLYTSLASFFWALFTAFEHNKR